MIDVALFGAGRIGTIHAGNVARDADVRLKYVVDVDAAAAQALATRHGAQTATVDGVFADEPPRYLANVATSSRRDPICCA